MVKASNSCDRFITAIRATFGAVTVAVVATPQHLRAPFEQYGCCSSLHAVGSVGCGPGRLHELLQAAAAACPRATAGRAGPRGARGHMQRGGRHASQAHVLGGLLKKFDLRKMPLCMFVRDLSISLLD